MDVDVDIVNLDMCERQMVQSVVDLGWLDHGQVQSCLSNRAQAELTETFLECYLLDERFINMKQFEHMSLYRHAPKKIAGYKISDVIGAGAMGVVYLADDSNHTGLALKVVNKKHCDDEEFIRRFERESEAVSRFKHENIVCAEGSGTYRGQLYLATEYVDGPGLDEVLEDYGALPEAYVLSIIGQVVRGLKHAYDSTGIVHRDIKPANILIDHQGAGLAESGAQTASEKDTVRSQRGTRQKTNLNIYPDHDVAKVIDFGLAKRTDDTDNLTITGLTVGTPHYMAPEQIRADKDIDSRVDIYSVGATMYHLLTGETPYSGNSPGGIMLAHVNDAVPDPSDVIPRLNADTVELVMCSLEKKKENRYDDYHAFLLMLEIAQESCAEHASGIQLLRKPLKKALGVIRKKPVRSAKRTPSSRTKKPVERAVSDPQKKPVQLNKGVKKNQQPTQSRTKQYVRSLATGASSRSLRRLFQRPTTPVKKSAVNDVDMHENTGMSLLLWIILATSVVCLLVIVLV